VECHSDTTRVCPQACWILPAGRIQHAWGCSREVSTDPFEPFLFFLFSFSSFFLAPASNLAEVLAGTFQSPAIRAIINASERLLFWRKMQPVSTCSCRPAQMAEYVCAPYKCTLPAPFLALVPLTGLSSTLCSTAQVQHCAQGVVTE
jgi:hypothetical protein